MSKEKSADVMEEAMQEALESVERIEQEREGEGGVDSEATVEVAVDESGPQSTESDADDQDPQAELVAAKEQLLRMAADFDNYRKRIRREQEETRRFGGEPILRDLLPVVDNLERALAHAGVESKNPVVEGVRMVAKQLLDVLAGHGAKSFDCEGELFDPELHDAMSQITAPQAKPGTIVAELERGYTLHGRLLRPAKVAVASVPAPEEDSVQAEDGSELSAESSSSS